VLGFEFLFLQEILVPTGFLVSRLLGTIERLHEHTLRRHKCSIPIFFGHSNRDSVLILDNQNFGDILQTHQTLQKGPFGVILTDSV